MSTRILLRFCLLITVLLTTGLAEAQQSKKVPRIGYLVASSPGQGSEAFRQGLRELGYVDGKNIVIEQRVAEGKSDRLTTFAAELVHLNVDVIVTAGSSATRPAKEATTTIPIVMASDNDPIGNGFVASLARPGGNITGLSNYSSELNGKRLELLKEIVPKLSRVSVLGNSTNPGNAQGLRETELAAAALGLKLQNLDVRDAKGLEVAIKERANAVLVLTSPVLIMLPQSARVAEFAAKNRLPAMYSRREYVENGGLTSYGVNLPDLSRRAAVYVDKILKGRKPADLPVEQPTKFELVINLKAAKQIGLTIPPNVLARADKVIK